MHSRFIAAASVVLAALAAPPAVAAPAVLLFPAVATPAQVTLSGRVVKDLPAGTTVWSKNVRSLTASGWVGVNIDIEVAGVRATLTSGHDGNFEVTLPAPKDRPFAGAQLTAEARVPGAVGRATVTIVPPSSPFVVISDFDDTVAVTNVTSKRGLVRAAILQDESSQPVVEGMPAFYRCLVDGKPARPGLAFVSGSPEQFLPRLVAFLEKHGFPTAGLYLRNLGPKTLSDYKQPILRALLSRLPQPVILVGDSGERDPEVYAQIRAEFPGRVAAVYIHDVGKSADPARFSGMLVFKHPREASADAVKRGFVAESCHAAAFAK